MKNKTSKKNGNGKNNRKSLKGTRGGQVGAPPKKTNWPNRPFTMEQLFEKNPNQCELSLRNKTDAQVATGFLTALATVKQPGGAVGRPKSRFVVTENFDPATMVKLGGTPIAKVKTPKARKAKTQTVVAVAPITPAIDPVPEVAPVADEVPASPAAAPIVTETVAPAPTVEAPVAAATPQPVIA